ncbi:MAG: hydrogen peroxide-inducible genes activator [Panacagrimonas sp.]
MTLTELRYLITLHKDRHFGHAAEHSYVSQPTLSVAIKKLEEQLGVVLFERLPGEVRATPMGERIVAQARRVLAEARLLEDMARAGTDALQGPLRFGSIYTVAPYLLPHMVPLLRQNAPSMPLIIEENFTATLLEQLRDNEIDVACMAVPDEHHGLSVCPLYDEDFVVVLPADHRWAGEVHISARRLAEEPLLLLGPGHCFRDQVIQACPKCVDQESGAPRPLTGSSLETIRYMVAGGLGLTVLPRSSVENRPASEAAMLIARPFSGKVPSRQIGLVWRKTFPRMKAIAALRDTILSCPMQGVKFRPDAAIIEG